MPIVPITLDHVGDHRRGRLDPAGAGALERDLADRVALQHDRVERALDRGERMVPVDERRPDADVDARRRRARAAPTRRITMLELARGGDVERRRSSVDPATRRRRARSAS